MLDWIVNGVELKSGRGATTDQGLQRCACTPVIEAPDRWNCSGLDCCIINIRATASTVNPDVIVISIVSL